MSNNKAEIQTHKYLAVLLKNIVGSGHLDEDASELSKILQHKNKNNEEKEEAKKTEE